MKIAVVGGNLLGCASALDLALVEEHDRRQHHSPRPISITLFERTSRLGGNSLCSHVVAPDLHVEVGTYRTLPLIPGSHLEDLVNVANDHQATLPIRNWRIPIPSSTVTRRGSPHALPVTTPWKHGSYRRVIRSFATYDAAADQYRFQHSGFRLFELLHRLLNHAFVRLIAISMLISAYRVLTNTAGHWPRALALANVVVSILVAVMSPHRVVAYWYRQFVFWITTFSMLFSHGLTPALVRGSLVGFSRHIAHINTKNASTVSASIASWISRCGLHAYLRATGADYVNMFKFKPQFVDDVIAPVVALNTGGRPMSKLSSLAVQFAMQQTDPANSDASIRLATLKPDNAAICSALIAAARASNTVDVRMETEVIAIECIDGSDKYRISSRDGVTEEDFDGVILCVSPRAGNADALQIRTKREAGLEELLGHEADAESVAQFAAQETTTQQNRAYSGTDTPIAASACSHVAVVIGKLNASFFRYNSERDVPDVVVVKNAPFVAEVERIRESGKDGDGVYRVICGEDFVSGDVVKQLFEEGAVVDYFAKLATLVYSESAIPQNRDLDESLPPIVLGPRFVFAAGLECLAKHPEVDAMAAANAASLFSKIVGWSQEEEEEEEDESGDE